MAVQLQLRRGTEAENTGFIGAQGELTYSTDTKSLRVHDGETMGGFPVDVVVAWQKPTADNNYTWYRKYASGWVEQGGQYNGKGVFTIPLSVPMADTKFTALVAPMIPNSQTDNNLLCFCRNVSTTSLTVCFYDSDGADPRDGIAGWEVKGMAA